MLVNSLRGTVYGTLLNFRGALEALGDAVHQPPLKAPPKAPILYIKPRNTHAGDGDAVALPPGVDALEFGASLALLIGRTACRVAERDALAHIAGYAIVNDVSVPHPSYYRPALRFKCRDGFCPIGPTVAKSAVNDPDALAIEVEVDGEIVQRAHTSTLIRPVAKLLADVTEFMTLSRGDLLLIGVPEGAPRLRAGQSATIRIGGLGELRNHVAAERIA
jgi:5-oxopent-3-ene-1,2,5-tricarboxylate decarboxylase/2-hydroxyhepta-2,4-diene-1,7-dioate isomerase